MIRWFKSGNLPFPFVPWRGRCAVDTCDMSCYMWYKEWPQVAPDKKVQFMASLQANIDDGRWVEDTSLELDEYLQVDEGL